MHLGGGGSLAGLGGGRQYGQPNPRGGWGPGRAQMASEGSFCCRLKIKYFHVSSSHSVPFPIFQLKNRRSDTQDQSAPLGRGWSGGAAQPTGTAPPGRACTLKLLPVSLKSKSGGASCVFATFAKSGSMSQGSGPPSSGPRTLPCLPALGVGGDPVGEEGTPRTPAFPTSGGQGTGGRARARPGISSGRRRTWGRSLPGCRGSLSTPGLSREHPLPGTCSTPSCSPPMPWARGLCRPGRTGQRRGPGQSLPAQAQHLRRPQPPPPEPKHLPVALADLAVLPELKTQGCQTHVPRGPH